jgi:hypothetical protein
MADLGLRSVNPLHGLERNKLKSVYNCGWRREVDAFSGVTYYFSFKGRFIAAGVDKRLNRIHACISEVNKNFRKIEP